MSGAHVCECGCGQPTRIAPYSCEKYGWRKGEPYRFVKGHSSRRPDFVVREMGFSSPCWVWEKCIGAQGYGETWNSETGRVETAHRVYYQLLVGTIPPGLQIDHLCRVRACCNPAHLEAVTPRENSRRGYWGQKTHCRAGHPYDEANTYINGKGDRICRACAQRRERERPPRTRRKAAA